MAKKKTETPAPAAPPPAPAADRPQTKTSRKIVGVAEGLVKAARRGQEPSLDVPVRALSNVRFNEKRRIIEMGDRTQQRRLFDLKNARRFMQTILVASACKEVVDQNITTSIRDLYYHCLGNVGDSSEQTFDDQSESDQCIEDLEVTLDSLREELGLHAENKGSMVGPMTIVDNGDTIDLTRMGSGGWSVPSVVEPDKIQFPRCDAAFILLIEKAAIWNRFNQDRFWQRQNCILIHGGGQPPRGVRRLCYRMNRELKLPVYVLADNDPWGYYIYSVVKQGSINLAYESKRMPIPDARFIGMSSFDKERFNIDDKVAIKLKDEDIERAKEIKEYPWFKNKKAWQEEIDNMLRKNRKMELEALSNKDFRFITETYLPEKIRQRLWLD
jgi:DNA topoisomerase-6 subunit A